MANAMTVTPTTEQLALLGRRVVVTNPHNHSEWRGEGIAIADHPSIVVEQGDGPRVTLPLAWARLETEADRNALLKTFPPCNCGSIDKWGDDLGEHSATCPYHLAAVRAFGETHAAERAEMPSEADVSLETPRDDRARLNFMPGEVLIDGSWFKVAELPTILEKYIARVAELERENKDALMTMTELKQVGASQDFRDGAATGAAIVETRLRTLESYGVPLTAELARQVARAVQEEHGGRVNPDALS